MSEKLQKVLSRLGLGSRRGIEKMIADGRITCDGVVAKIGDRIDEDKVKVQIDGRTVLSMQTEKPKCRVLMYHKPEGELTTLNDPEDRPTVFDHLPKPESGRWIYVGRLDINTSGLLLFTTDGDLANALMHPRHGIERVYASRIYGDVTDEIINNLQEGVLLEDGKAHFDKIVYVGGEARNAWYHVSLKEGRKREVRRLWESQGVKVSRLIRISYGGIELDPRLKAGQYGELTLRELNKLRRLADMEPLTISDMPEDPLQNIDGKAVSKRIKSITRANAQKEETTSFRERPRFPGSLGNEAYENSKKAVLKSKRNDDVDEDLSQSNRGLKKPFNKDFKQKKPFSKFAKTRSTGDRVFDKKTSSGFNRSKKRDDFSRSFNDEGTSNRGQWQKGPGFKSQENKSKGGFKSSSSNRGFKHSSFEEGKSFDRRGGFKHSDKKFSNRQEGRFDSRRDGKNFDGNHGRGYEGNFEERRGFNHKKRPSYGVKRRNYQ